MVIDLHSAKDLLNVNCENRNLWREDYKKLFTKIILGSV